jgi:hypothetical protein
VSYWQIASGEGRRDYADRFLKHGIAFVGERYAPRMQQVEVGDFIVLKKGKRKILAVGKVVEREGKYFGIGDKEWLRDFDGWDLPAYCYVQWHQPSGPEPVKGLTQDAISRIQIPELQEIADDLLQLPPTASKQVEPRPTREVEDSEILEFLIQEGLSPAVAEDLAAAIHRVRLLAHYYYEQWPHWGDIREHEARTFLIVPVLLALGWSEQQIKIELATQRAKRIDIACFRKAYRRDSEGKPNNGDCALIIESKDFSSGLDYTREQAVAYAENFPSCRAVLVSNGYCYKAYEREDAGLFSQEPSAYLNLLRPRDRYPLDPEHVDGALAVLRVMLPQSWR